MALRAARAAESTKAEEIDVLDLRQKTPVTDFFVICHGRNRMHVQAIGERVEEALAGQLHHREGADGNTWVLLDFGAVVVHVFQEETRRFYDLERLWGDADHLDWGAAE